MRVASLLGALGLAAVIAAPTAPSIAATPTLTGSWLVDICYDTDRKTISGGICPNSPSGLAQCFTFTRLPNLVSDLPYSGTWQDFISPPYHGHWTQVGDRVSFVGTYQSVSGETIAVSFVGAMFGRNTINGQAYLGSIINTATGAHSYAESGTWRARKVASCDSASPASSGGPKRLPGQTQ